MLRQERINHCLKNTFKPDLLEVLDESHSHSRPGVETHFKVTVVSSEFNDLALVARHRLVYSLLNAELQSGLHALSLHLYTPDEWAKRNRIPSTPPCQHQHTRE